MGFINLLLNNLIGQIIQPWYKYNLKLRVYKNEPLIGSCCPVSVKVLLKYSPRTTAKVIRRVVNITSKIIITPTVQFCCDMIHTNVQCICKYT